MGNLILCVPHEHREISRKIADVDKGCANLIISSPLRIRNDLIDRLDCLMLSRSM